MGTKRLSAKTRLMQRSTRLSTNSITWARPRVADAVEETGAIPVLSTRSEHADTLDRGAWRLGSRLFLGSRNRIEPDAVQTRDVEVAAIAAVPWEIPPVNRIAAA